MASNIYLFQSERPTLGETQYLYKNPQDIYLHFNCYYITTFGVKEHRIFLKEVKHLNLTHLNTHILK